MWLVRNMSIFHSKDYLRLVAKFSRSYFVMQFISVPFFACCCQNIPKIAYDKLLIVFWTKRLELSLHYSAISATQASGNIFCPGFEFTFAC